MTQQTSSVNKETVRMVLFGRGVCIVEEFYGNWGKGGLVGGNLRRCNHVNWRALKGSHVDSDYKFIDLFNF